MKECFSEFPHLLPKTESENENVWSPSIKLCLNLRVLSILIDLLYSHNHKMIECKKKNKKTKHNYGIGDGCPGYSEGTISSNG